jgi:hypothetical protein
MTDDEAARRAADWASERAAPKRDAGAEGRVVIDLLPLEVLELEIGAPLSEAEAFGQWPETGPDVA